MLCADMLQYIQNLFLGLDKALSNGVTVSHQCIDNATVAVHFLASRSVVFVLRKPDTPHSIIRDYSAAMFLIEVIVQ